MLQCLFLHSLLSPCLRLAPITASINLGKASHYRARHHDIVLLLPVTPTPRNHSSTTNHSNNQLVHFSHIFRTDSPPLLRHLSQASFCFSIVSAGRAAAQVFVLFPTFSSKHFLQRRKVPTTKYFVIFRCQLISAG